MKYQSLCIRSLLFAAVLNQSCDSSSSSSSNPPLGSGTPTGNTTGDNATGTVPPGTTPGADTATTTPIVETETKPYVISGNSFQLIAGLRNNRAGFIKDLGAGVSSKIASFEGATTDLTAAANAYCASYSPESLTALKDKFKTAMLDWQQLELYQMGPMTEKNSTLKSKIYNWPIVPYLCKIDEQSMFAREDGDEFLFPEENNKIGLQALEYLIFEETLETGCPIGEIKTKWLALSRQEKLEARCAYMKPVARELGVNASTLKTAWGTTADNYLSRKVGNAEAEQSAMQEMFNNILYIDIEMKNKKIGIPAGQDIKGCPKSPAPCIDKQELRYSRLSREALSENVKVLADIIFGFGEPRRGGLSAIIRQESAPASAEKSEKNVSDLLTLIDTEKSNFDDLLAKKNEDCEATQVSWICQVQKSIKTVVADFKAEYANVLKVNVPVEKQGDND
ncbi:MAG: imelysin family protein [Bdellovibrionota bacterium]